jgi:sRNA-binding protein
LRIRNGTPVPTSGGEGLRYPVETINGGQFQDMDGSVGWADESNLQSQAQYDDAQAAQQRRVEEQRRAEQARRERQQPPTATDQQAQRSSRIQREGQGILDVCLDKMSQFLGRKR